MVMAVLREFTHLLQVMAIGCIGFVLWLLLEGERAKNLANLISRRKR
jgi:hypothetical protein